MSGKSNIKKLLIRDIAMMALYKEKKPVIRFRMTALAKLCCGKPSRQCNAVGNLVENGRVCEILDKQL